MIAAFVVKEARASCTELCSPSRTDCIASQSIGRAELAAMSYPRFLRLCFATSPHDRVGADAFDIDGVALSTADAIDALVAHGIAAAFVQNEFKLKRIIGMDFDAGQYRWVKCRA